MSLEELRANLAKLQTTKTETDDLILRFSEKQERYEQNSQQHLSNAAKRKKETPSNINGIKRHLTLKIMKDKSKQDLQNKINSLMALSMKLGNKIMILQMKIDRLETEEWMAKTMENTIAQQKESEAELARLMAEMGLNKKNNDNNNNNNNNSEPKTVCNKLGRCFSRWTKKNKNKKKGGASKRLATRRN